MIFYQAKLYVDCTNCGTNFTSIIDPKNDDVKCPYCGQECKANVSILVTNATGKQITVGIN